MSAALTCSGDQRGCAWRTRAAVPATWGAAIEVPDSRSPPMPVPAAADKTDTPGAAMSGFSALSPLRGPPAEKSAVPRYVGFGIVIGPVIVTALPSAPSSAAPSEGITPRNGIVAPAIVPSCGGNAPAVVL